VLISGVRKGTFPLGPDHETSFAAATRANHYLATVLVAVRIKTRGGQKKRHETLSVLCQSRTLQLEASLGEARISSFGFP
jgi:hypothetical protein